MMKSRRPRKWAAALFREHLRQADSLWMPLLAGSTKPAPEGRRSLLPDTAGRRGAFFGLYFEITAPKQKTGKRSYTLNFINLSGYKSRQAASPIAGRSLSEYILKLAPPDELCYNKKRLF